MSLYVFSNPEGPEELILRHVDANCKIIGPQAYSDEIRTCFSLMYRLVKELRTKVDAAEAALNRAPPSEKDGR